MNMGGTKKCFLFVIPFILIVFFLSLTPIVSRDALIHHMALPKIWLNKGFLVVEKFKDFSFYPQNAQILYYLSIRYKLDFLPKIIHASFLILTAVLVSRYVLYHSRSACLSSLAFIIFLTIPINQKLVSEVYVDLFLMFFSTLSLLYFLKWKNSLFLRKYFYISSISAGVFLGTKLNGLIPFFIINACVVFAYSRTKQKNVESILQGVQFFIIAFMLFSPWLLRDYFASGGNPFYPLFSSVFPDNMDSFVPLFKQGGSEFLFRRYEGESLLDIFLLPLRVFFEGKDDDLLHFDGKLNPMMILLLPLSFFLKRNSKVSEKWGKDFGSDKYYMLIFFIVSLFISIHYPVRIRYFIYIIPPIVIMNMHSIDILVNSSKKFFVVFGYVIVAFYILYNLLYTVNIFYRVDTFRFLTFQENREEYLDRKVDMFKIYKFINNSTPKDSVIYDVMSGQRSYYVDRNYVHDRYYLDTHFYNYAFRNGSAREYLSYLGSVEYYGGKGATHLLIRPFLFIETLKKIFYKEKGDERQMAKAIDIFLSFLRSQKLLFHDNDVYLYELVYSDKKFH